MHAIDTPFEFLIHEISNIGEAERPRAAAHRLKFNLTNTLLLLRSGPLRGPDFARRQLI
jgi:hypothetical protein